MASGTVTLGGITLRGHEVPSKIPFGGHHRLAKNVMIGGRRVTDAMGYQPNDGKWEGRFRGEDALSRALALDAMCQQGGQVPLTWGGLYRLVVIEEFEPDYQRSFDIPYRISCYVVDDGSGGGGGGGIADSIDALVGADLSSALGLIVPATAAAVAVGTLSDAIAATGGLAGVAASDVPPVQMAASDALGIVDAAITAGNAAIDAANAPDPSLPAGIGMMRSVLATVDAVAGQAALVALRGPVGRIATNLSTIG